MNDIKSVLNFCDVSLYADDTVIWTNGVNIFDLQDKLQQDLISIMYWLRANKLSINVSKCKSMLVHSVNHPIRGTNLRVKIDNEYLECVSAYKYLGIYLDTTLSFSEHIDYMRRKINKRLGVLRVSRTYMKPEQCTILYKSLVLPLFDYGDIAYMDANVQNLESLQILQNRACRIILRRPRLSPTADMHISLKLMTLSKRRLYHLNLFTHKSQLGLLPTYISNKLYPKPYQQAVVTREATRHDLFVPRYRLSKTSCAFTVKCPAQHNVLPVHVRESPTVNCFKSRYFNEYGFI